ncbi:hypothetical protein [Methanocella arvoryzae]|uniref:Uncharacterized protein n=1 Tax=Methanocella arvoryzae (strain DSM 22066 / NBRC 105507 / MRE50) TaxID=351160 RepID=Q0W0L1_METAR|nr:hypothetical protein [Methanocella arvoryzae]CAJ38082.1 hypothetical protein RRC366 [Methanocella arvoryzae MRE50]
MIKVAIPHKIYSENKIKIKNIIKKYGMSWDSGKNGWVSAATGDGVYIDRAIMDMILSDSFSGDMPMTMFIESDNADFLAEMEAKCKAIGGEFIKDVTPEVAAPQQQKVLPQPAASSVNSKPGIIKGSDVFVRLNLRDADGCNTPEFCARGLEDLQNISRRWERRKAQLIRDYGSLGFDAETLARMLHREEINFRKNNACWVTGEFPGQEKGARSDSSDE